MPACIRGRGWHRLLLICFLSQHGTGRRLYAHVICRLRLQRGAGPPEPSDARIPGGPEEEPKPLSPRLSCSHAFLWKQTKANTNVFWLKLPLWFIWFVLNWTRWQLSASESRSLGCPWWPWMHHSISCIPDANAHHTYALRRERHKDCRFQLHVCKYFSLFRQHMDVGTCHQMVQYPLPSNL